MTVNVADTTEHRNYPLPHQDNTLDADVARIRQALSGADADVKTLFDQIAAEASARSSADALLAPLTSPVLTGNPTAPTQLLDDNSLRIATTAFVQGVVAGLVDSSPEALNTLSEFATALGNDPNFATTITNLIAQKMAIAGGNFTGAVTIEGNKVLVSGGVNQGGITLTVNDSDFVLADTTDGLTNYFWRDHSASKLYLGTPDAVPTLRSNLDLNGNRILNAPGLRKVHYIASGTDYTRTSQTEGNMSNGLTFTPVNSGSMFITLAWARGDVYSTAGGVSARADLRLRYYNTANAAWATLATMTSGMANTQPNSTSGNRNYSYYTATGLSINSSGLVVYGSSANQVHLRIRGEAGYSNNNVRVQDHRIVCLEYGS